MLVPIILLLPAQFSLPLHRQRRHTPHHRPTRLPRMIPENHARPPRYPPLRQHPVHPAVPMPMPIHWYRGGHSRQPQHGNRERRLARDDTGAQARHVPHAVEEPGAGAAGGHAARVECHAEAVA
ncbi:hypothetical protein C8R46DRAFT_1100571 [Mycena filopes]|nr:hypothetical protein C8R46DRAFT_1100571 [Mycena filopes]